MYDDPNQRWNPSPPVSTGGFFGQTIEDSGIIWEFNGSRFLEARDIVMQVRRNPNLTLGQVKPPSPSVFFSHNIPEDFRRDGEGGIWIPALPVFEKPSFINLVPKFFPHSASRLPGSEAGNNYNFNFTVDGDGIGSGRVFEFIFHLEPNNENAEDLFIARLDIAPGSGIPSDWFRQIRPFSMLFQDIRLQRAGVTILNNVINPLNGEHTYIDYRLVRGGQVTIQVFTLDGTMVDVLFRGHRDAGEYRAAWNGTNRAGRAVARGMYFIRVVGPDMDEIRQVMVVR
jgi:hypothetical protein